MTVITAPPISRAIDFQCSVVFQANYESKADIVINQGGTDSGKTVAIMQVLTIIATHTKPPDKDDPIITIVNKNIPDAKKGAYRKFEAIATNPFVLSRIANWNKGERVITFTTGWVMEFLGTTDEQAAKQGKRQYLFVNEANGITWPIFWQMAKRTRVRTFIDYNPSAPFWSHEKLINTLPTTNDLGAIVQLIISDHRHNPFLSDKDHAKTEGIQDPERWKVYARGMTGNLEGLIYTNWKMIPDKEFPWNDDSKFGGLDFGYTNDPTAAVSMRRIANNIFIHELCYEPAMTNIRIKQLFYASGFDSDTHVYCEHDPDAIKQLRMLELLCIAARKGPGSIKAGIQKVGEYNIFYTASSRNLEYERSKYMWDKDPDTGKSLNSPIDKDNHILDAIRMGIYTHFYHED